LSNIKAEKHSLYVKNTTTRNFRVFIDSFINEENTIHDIFDSLLDAGNNDTLELRISSPGGLVTECQQIVNIINNKFKDRSTAYIDSHASSAGAFTFCSCNKRVIYENSRLMLHNYSGGHSGKHQDMKDRLEFDTDHIISFLKSNIKVGKKGFLSKKEFKKMIEGKNYWFNADDMLKRGIATHIIINGEEISREDYFKKGDS
jgi:ATP-dependent protease ClpP protease subunit